MYSATLIDLHVLYLGEIISAFDIRTERENYRFII